MVLDRPAQHRQIRHCLIDNARIEWLRPSDFDGNRVGVAEAMRRLWSRGDPVDAVTLKDAGVPRRILLAEVIEVLR